VRTTTRLFACLALTTLVVPLYLFEAYLWATAAPDRIASKTGHVVKLREQGFAAYPAVFPSGFLRLWQSSGDNSASPITIDGQEILPLAGIPDVLTVYCPAADLDMLTYRSDALGFRNPTGTGRREAPEFAVLGDSFAQGFCVSDPFTYAEQISVLGPTASYGMNGTSPLTQLAIYREYVKALRPHRIVWFFYEGNDPEDYLAERTWPLLRAYLERGHSQGLVSSNEPISLAMKRFIDQRLGSVEVAALGLERRPPMLGEMVDFLLLRRARAILRLRLSGQPFIAFPPELTETKWHEVADIWREVIEAQRMQGGQITFVYIPAHWRFLANDPAPFQVLEQTVVTLWSGLGVDYLSLTELLEATGDPLAYYGDDLHHFSEKGYRLTGDAIVRHLRRSSGE
jgi:hypothetical protein